MSGSTTKAKSVGWGAAGSSQTGGKFDYDVLDQHAMPPPMPGSKREELDTTPATETTNAGE